MLRTKYQNQIKTVIAKHLGRKVKIFIFGSSVKDKKFNDIDVGVMGGNIRESKLSLIREELENSPLPYKVDVINFNKADKKFKEKVLGDKILWLT